MVKLLSAGGFMKENFRDNSSLVSDFLIQSQKKDQ